MEDTNQVKQLREIYQACSNKLQVLSPAIASLPEHWVDLPPLMAQLQFLVDIHEHLGYYGWDKLLISLCGFYLWLGMHLDVATCIQNCLVYHQDKLPALPKEELC